MARRAGVVWVSGQMVWQGRGTCAGYIERKATAKCSTVPVSQTRRIARPNTDDNKPSHPLSNHSAPPLLATAAQIALAASPPPLSTTSSLRLPLPMPPSPTPILRAT